jgi:Predicted membrane protein
MQNMSGGKTALGLDTNVGAMLCYLPICAISLIYSIIVIVADKDNKSVRFHAFQSLLLTGAYIVVILAVAIFGGIIVGITGSSILGGLLTLVYFAVIGIFLIVMIYGCVKAYQGSQFKLPIVGDMAEKWS